MLKFPKIYKVLEHQVSRKQKNQRGMEFAIVEDGFLIATSGVMVVKIDLRIYFSDAEVKFVEGKVFSIPLLKAMAGPEVKSISLGFDTVAIKDAHHTHVFYTAGCKDGEQYHLRNIDTGTDTGEFITYPNYKALFPDNFIPKSYPYTGINAKTLGILAHSFAQSAYVFTHSNVDDGFNLTIESREVEGNNMQQGNVTPFRVRPTVIANDKYPDGEVAMFMPSNVVGLREMEELI